MSSEPERNVDEPRPFSIAADPSLRALHRLHLTRRDGTPRAWALVAIAWVPLFVAALLRVAIGQRPAPILFDISVHARLLIAVPVMIHAERILSLRCRSAIDQLYAGRFADRAAVDLIIDKAERMRDSRLVEVALIVVVLLAGQAALWGLLAPTGVIAGGSEAGSLSFARLWYVTVALPIAQFVMARWLWHWVIWSYVVVRVSRLPLATIATHPDRAAGIGFLGIPMSAFSGFVLAISAILSSAWGTQILAGRAALQAFVPSFISFVILSALVACGPLLLYIGMLYRARHRELEQYNSLALSYVRTFHRKWIEARRDPEALLGTPDLQSLNDLIGSYQNLDQIRLVPFGPRPMISVWIATVTPMLPLVATTMPLDELLGHIGRALLGGIVG